MPVLSHIPNLHEHRFAFQNDLMRISNLRLYNSRGNLRRTTSRDLHSLTSDFADVQGNIEAARDLLEACPQSGKDILTTLANEFPASLVTPIPIGITSEGTIASWHYHHLPVTNILLASYIAALGRSCSTWDSTESSAVTKLFILIDGRALEARGIHIDSWTRSIPWNEFLLYLRSKLPIAEIRGLTFYHGIQSPEVNTILFPEHWLHYVVTVNHESAGRTHKRYWTGISAYYVPRTESACQRLSQHINEHQKDAHLWHQNSQWYDLAQSTIHEAQTLALSLASTIAPATLTALSLTKADADGKT